MIIYNIKSYLDKSFKLNFKIGEDDKDNQRLSVIHKIKFIGYFVVTVISVIWYYCFYLVWHFHLCKM
jgi:hypothetical protein